MLADILCKDDWLRVINTFFTMMIRLFPLSLTLALFVTINPLFAKDTIPLMIYGVSIGEEKAVVVKTKL